MQFLYLIILFWFASLAYQVSLVEPWFIHWQDVVDPRYLKGTKYGMISDMIGLLQIQLE